MSSWSELVQLLAVSMIIDYKGLVKFQIISFCWWPGKIESTLTLSRKPTFSHQWPPFTCSLCIHLFRGVSPGSNWFTARYCSRRVYTKNASHSYANLLNAAVCLRIFIYKGPRMKLCSVCGADRAQSNGPTLRPLANFHIELEQFCCSFTAA